LQVLDTGTTPFITSAATASFAENGTGTVYTATATDADSGTTLTYSLGGTDVALFNINASTGVVTFKTAPNFESPADAGTNNVYDITVTANDGVNTSAVKAVTVTVTDLVESLAGQSVIDLGSYGKLIRPVQVDGGKWYYHWDRSGDGTSADTGSLNGGVDYTTHAVLDGIFKYDVNGVLNTAVGTKTTDTYRYATINGVHLALPTLGGNGINLFQPGTTVGSATPAVGSNAVNATYNDLLAVWDAYNGTGTNTLSDGTPPGWQAGTYWSATALASGHVYFDINNGHVIDYDPFFDDYVALEVLGNPPNADTTVPTLTSSTPSDNAAAVLASANLTLTFSEAIKAGSGSLVLTNTTNATDTRTVSVSDASQVSISGSQLTLNPTADLLGGAHYALTLGSAVVQDLAGNAYAGISSATTLDFNVAASNGKPTLSGIAYDWKNHMLLQDVAIAIKGGGTPAEGSNAPIQFKGLVWDASGHASVEVWTHATTAFESAGFDLEITNASGITFTAGALPNTSTGGTGWTLITNASGTNLTVGGFANDISAAVAAGDLKLGTITFETDALQRADLHLVGGDVGNTSATAYGLSMVRASSNASGAFSISTLEPGSYDLSASRTVTDIGNAISSADALATLKIAVGLNPNLDPDGTGPLSALALSPYQFMAADVVGTDGRITSADALAILKLAVKLPTAPTKEWMFVEEGRDFWNEATGQFTLDRTHASWDHSISTTIQSDAMVNLVGVLKGDVNGSWVAPVGSTDLDAIDPTYFSTLSSIFGMPLTQFALG
jgi:methionine-rich copper-binding protein CopC